MKYNQDTFIAMSELSTNFYKVWETINENRIAVIHKNREPYYVVLDFDDYEELRETAGSGIARMEGETQKVIVHTPPFMIHVKEYMEQHPAAALICTNALEFRWMKKEMLLLEGSAERILLLYDELAESPYGSLRCYMPEVWIQQMAKRFRAEPPEIADRVLGGTSKILSIFSSSRGILDAMFFGQLRALFGEPVVLTSNAENEYSYCISVTEENKAPIYLDVYSGSSGPSIGGYREDIRAARLLRHYILQARPADYEYEGVYEDGPSLIKMGVKQGCPYYRETPLPRPEDEDEDEECEYWISATDENNQTIYFYTELEPSEQMVKELLESVLTNEKYKTICSCDFTFIKMGSKNGCPYYEERRMEELPEMEVHRLFGD